MWKFKLARYLSSATPDNYCVFATNNSEIYIHHIVSNKNAAQAHIDKLKSQPDWTPFGRTNWHEGTDPYDDPEFDHSEPWQ